MKSGEYLLQIRDDKEKVWSTLNRAVEDGSGKMVAGLQHTAQGWRDTVYPLATFRVVPRQDGHLP